MKLVKLSLVAALAAGAFSVANATPLEEAIKDIDVSGMLRYRYETGRWDNGRDFGGSIDGKQDHKYKAQFNLSGSIADNFKAFVQFQYATTDKGYGRNHVDKTDKLISVGSYSDTSSTFNVRQAYLTYMNEYSATSVMFGKQELDTIWTDDLVGTGVKVVNNSIDGLTLSAFAVDAFDAKVDPSLNEFSGSSGSDGDASPYLNWAKNLYGAAVLGSYEVLGGQFNPQLWLAYMSENAFLYALDSSYSTTIFDGVNWTLQGAYLGNSLDNELKEAYLHGIDNGNFFALRGSVEVAGWDASLGGLYYGKRTKETITAIEDQGRLGSLLAGQEIFYTDGSNLNGDTGRNIFGYVTAGYTFDDTVRVGGDFVYGGTKTSKTVGYGAKKLEAVARVDYKYSPKLSFSAFYSYVDVNKKQSDDGSKDTVRLQALYKF